MIKEKKKGKQAFRSKQFNVAGISHGVGGGKSRRILFSLFLSMITKLPVAVVGVCSPTSFDTWGPFRMSFVVAKLCGLAYGGCCGIHIAGIFYRRPNLLHMEKRKARTNSYFFCFRGGVMGLPKLMPPWTYFCFFSAGFKICQVR